MWYDYRIMKLKHAVYLLLLLLSGCASTTKVSPGATFLVGLNGYQDEMERLEGRPELWADRQRAGDALKRTYVATIGTSREFNRMVDLDVRRREFLITLRDLTLKPDRVKEMKDELVTMNRDVDALKEIIKGQTGNAELRAQQQPQQLETVATIGLVSMAIDSFSFMTVPTGPNPPSTKVGPYVVSDFGGLLSTVTTPAGQTFRCSTLLIPDMGASIKCEAPGNKS
jgi:outer membrane murein-binding lipoprotein Lpp